MLKILLAVRKLGANILMASMITSKDINALSYALFADANCLTFPMITITKPPAQLHILK
jgi:hypothetical protein